MIAESDKYCRAMAVRFNREFSLLNSGALKTPLVTLEDGKRIWKEKYVG
jgi:hypothetical protein